MRKLSIACAALSVLVALVSPLAAAAAGISPEIAIYVNSQLVGMDTVPFVYRGTTLVPIRFISAELGATIEWRNPYAVITYGDMTITMQSGSSVVSVNGNDVTLPLPVQMRDGRLFVPLRFVSEQLGATVHYHDFVIDIISDRPSPNGKSYNSAFHFADKKEGLYIRAWDAAERYYYIMFVDREDFATSRLITGLGMVTSVNVVGQHIFYDENGVLKRHDMETGESITVAQGVYRAYVAGGKIWYLSDPYNPGSLWRMNIDGSGKEQVAESVQGYVIVGGAFYRILHWDGSIAFSNGYTYYYQTISGGGPLENYGILGRRRAAGAESETVLTLEKNSWFGSVRVIGNWIYYRPTHMEPYSDAHFAEGAGSLYRVSLDGQSREQLTNEKTMEFHNFRGGFAYMNVDNEIRFVSHR